MAISQRLPSVRTLIRVALASTVAIGAPALASVPDVVCGSARGDATRFPTSQDLLAAAADVEQRLRDTRGATVSSNILLDRLDVPLTSVEPPEQAARARYCAAAGDAMRVSAQGSQFQAQAYLLKAFREASSVGPTPLAAQAAYRLGLVSVAAPAAANARGGGRRTRSPLSQVVEQAEQVASAPTGACERLDAPTFLSQTNAYITVASLQCAIERGRQANEPALAALASLRLARFGLALSSAEEQLSEQRRRLSLETVVTAIPDAERVSSPALRTELLGRLVSTALDLGSTDRALMIRSIASLRTQHVTDATAAAFADALEARLALMNGDAARARQLLSQAILSESQRPLPSRLPDWYLLMASAEPDARRQHVAAAYRALESIRPLLPRIDPLTEEPSFALTMRPVFEAAVDVQLASATGGDETARIRDAQLIVETFRQAELQSVFGSECLPPREIVRPEQLRAGEILLYPILLPDRLEIIYAKGGEPGYKRLPANMSMDRRQVSRLVERTVLALSGSGEDDWRESAAQLYQLIVKPIEAELGPESMLAIIPDGPLRAVPFAALIDGDGRYLVQRTRISVAPSLAYSQPGGSSGEADRTVVAASLQKELELPIGYFPKLEGTAEEAMIAAHAESGITGRFIPDFRKADLVSALGQGKVDVSHLATHASFNGRSDRAFIVADGEIIPMTELRDLIAQNRTRGEELDLLVLSACETAVGDDEASMGLAGAAVQAGAESAIASLWQVNDVGTAALMKDFYGRFKAGGSKSESLRGAQLAMIDGGGETADPNIWAAFTLLGAWR